jgi:hypothetical protein
MIGEVWLACRGVNVEFSCEVPRECPVEALRRSMVSALYRCCIRTALTFPSKRLHHSSFIFCQLWVYKDKYELTYPHNSVSGSMKRAKTPFLSSLKNVLF